MIYNGNRIIEITERPQDFTPHLMLCWEKDPIHPLEEYVIAIVKRSDDILFITDHSVWTHGAEIPSKKPESRRVTNRELSKWLVQGNGEMTFKSKSERDIDHLVFASHCYEEEYADEECDKALKRNDDGSWIVVRKWDDTDWHEPTAAYMGLEDK